MSRGRSYARAGQVISFEIARGNVRAQVQGSQPRPFRALGRRIGAPPLAQAHQPLLDQAGADPARAEALAEQQFAQAHA